MLQFSNKDRQRHGGLNASQSVSAPSELASKADIGSMLSAATITIAADNAERHAGVEAMGKPKSSLALKRRSTNLHVVLPGAEGIGALAVATAAAMPRRASVRLSPICDCKDLVCVPDCASTFGRAAL
jgi:hypothetical protein